MENVFLMHVNCNICGEFCTKIVVVVFPSSSCPPIPLFGEKLFDSSVGSAKFAFAFPPQNSFTFQLMHHSFIESALKTESEPKISHPLRKLILSPGTVKELKGGTGFTSVNKTRLITPNYVGP